ncbi:MAG: redoxin domain-containing protein [Planctomycetota bacterium]
MKNDGLSVREGVIAAGETAPDFMLLDQDRNEWKLSEALEAGDVVLSFFPMAFTGVCGSEMACARDESAQWKDSGATFVGISCDSFAVQNAWAEKEGYGHRLLADMHRQVCRAYGLYWADLNVASRGTVIVTKGADGAPTVRWSQSREVMDAFKLDEVVAAAKG